MCLCQYNILFLIIKKLSACELPMFELCFNVSLVQILFEYIVPTGQIAGTPPTRVDYENLCKDERRNVLEREGRAIVIL